MTAMFNMEDLTTIAEEPLVLDLLLAERLEFAQPRDIRKLIDRNAQELSSYGEVCAIVAQTSPEGGRPSKAYYLNEDQAVLISMFSRTPKAAEVRKALIEIYKKWRAAHAGPSPMAALPAPAAPAQSIVNVSVPFHDDTMTLRDKLAAVTVTRQIYGLAAARAMWPKVGLPDVAMVEAPAPNANAQADAIKALQLLLSHSTNLVDEDDHEITVFDTIQRALEDDDLAIVDCRRWGIRILEDGEESEEPVVWIAYHGEELRRVYSRTKWADAWRLAFKNLPGAQSGKKPHKVGNAASWGICIPVETVALARPDETLTWTSLKVGNEDARKAVLV